MKTERSSRWLAGLFLVNAIVTVLWILLPSMLSNATNSDSVSVLDINIHDTYFVVDNTHILGLIAIFAFAFSLFYFSYTRMTGFLLSERLGWAHGIGSSVMVLLPLPTLHFAMVSARAPRRYHSYSEAPMFDDGGVIDVITIFLVVGIISQICFVVNVAASPFRKRA